MDRHADFSDDRCSPGVSGSCRRSLRNSRTARKTVSGDARHLRDRCPERALVLEQNGELKGFVLARNGRLAVQIGPLSARSQDDAITLLDSVLSQGGPAFLDAADHQRSLAMWLTKAGFSRQRGYMRMLLKQDDPMDVPAQVFLIAGPELG